MSENKTNINCLILFYSNFIEFLYLQGFARIWILHNLIKKILKISKNSQKCLKIGIFLLGIGQLILLLTPYQIFN